MTSSPKSGRMGSAIDFASPLEDEPRDTPPRCMSCGHKLTDTDPLKLKCLQCGRAFNPHDRTSFTYLPLFEPRRMWMPGAVLAAIALIIVLLIAGLDKAALLAAVLALIGVLLGYGSGFLVALTLGLAMLVVGVLYVTAVDIFHGHGSYRMVLPTTTIPVLAGAIAGIALRHLLKHTNFQQRWYLP
ncbi:MAG: hypothetical protein IT445_01705 [Phycisphaeraceae bacterium]|nr:hypothetical protein [Phycisphaeraceae bacterium]